MRELGGLSAILLIGGEMLKLLDVHLINPGTDRVMCTRMRKNVNHTDELLRMTCRKCIDRYIINHDWWAEKLPQEIKLRLEQ